MSDREIVRLEEEIKELKREGIEAYHKGDYSRFRKILDDLLPELEEKLKKEKENENSASNEWPTSNKAQQNGDDIEVIPVDEPIVAEVAEPIVAEVAEPIVVEAVSEIDKEAEEIKRI